MQETKVARPRYSANVAIAALLSGAHALLAVSLVPASVAGVVVVALFVMDTGVEPEMIVVPTTLAALVLVAVIEHKSRWLRITAEGRIDRPFGRLTSSIRGL